MAVTAAMEDLAAWLTAVWDEEERLAKAGTPGPWHTPGPDTIAEWTVYDSEWSVATATAYDHNNALSSKPGARGPGYIDPNANAAHIAYHDPASVLARIAADRKILALHGVAWNAEVCTVCHHLTDDDLHIDNDPWPCATVRALAEPHADKPGFRSEWLIERQGVEGAPATTLADTGNFIVRVPKEES